MGGGLRPPPPLLAMKSEIAAIFQMNRLIEAALGLHEFL